MGTSPLCGLIQFLRRGDCLREVLLLLGEGAEVTLDLDAVPEGFRLAEESTEANGHRRGDGSLSQDNFIDGTGWDSNGAGHRVLRNPQGFDVFFEEDLSGGDRSFHGCNVSRYG